MLIHRCVVDFGESERRVFENPTSVITAHDLESVMPALEAVQRACTTGAYAVGYVSYEAAPAFESRMLVATGARMPLVWFGIYSRATSQLNTGGAYELGEFTCEFSRARHASAVAHVHEGIASGAVYQVNLTTRLRANFAGEPLALYEQLRRGQGAGYHAYIDTGDFQIVSLSPELFFQIREGVITTRPMKGTRPRGRYLAEDEAIAHELSASQKDRAENLMIVDLLRNDVGRLAQYDSVHVPSLFQLERYHTVWQMTSTVTACLRRGVTLVDILRALFPSGSVTGAPKISALGYIAELETAPREVYCGAIGVIEPDGGCTFSVPIRTLWIDRSCGTAEYGAGGGITWDSAANAEYDELLAKAVVVRQSWPEFQLFETMRAEAGVVVRLDRHLQRLSESARYFGFVYDDMRTRDRIAQLVAGLREPSRVRLLLAQNGCVRFETSGLECAQTHATFALACTPVQSTDRFLFHKTTHRAVYARHVMQHPETFDVLLWNERNELTEFTRGNMVVQIDGRKLTPARTCGLLAGTLRAELLEAGELEEAILYKSDLRRATRVWFINSLRGWLDIRTTERAAGAGLSHGATGRTE